MKENKRPYGVTQEILYTLCMLAWKLCSEYLPKFTSLKAFYTEAFIADAQQAVRDAKQLPTSNQTKTFCKNARIKLSASTRQMLLSWKMLKGYIITAFDEREVKSMLEAAGASYYQKASVDNWTAVRTLIDEATIFIAEHLAELTANDNMPADFQASFKAAGDNCIALSSVYSDATLQKQRTTSLKVAANNAIYSSLTDMLKDGQLVFQDAPATKRQFIYKHLVSNYRKEHSASLKGYIVDELGRPVEGVAVLSVDEKYGTVSDSKGYYKITRIEAGTYNFNITCFGYEPLLLTFNFAAGVSTKGDFAITSIMKKVA